MVPKLSCARWHAVVAMFLLLGLILCRTGVAEEADHWRRAREQLTRIISQGVKDPRVLAVVSKTERHLFVPESQRKNAYFDMSLPIGGGVTISPPYVVAFMTEQLRPQPTDRVLEIGTGSGYQAAMLSPLVSEVYTIEIVEDLGRQAAERLKRLAYDNVRVKVGDGFQGWPEHAPFDKIIVTCSPEKIPEPLIAQLKDGGTMLIPLGKRFEQSLCLVTKRDGKLKREVLESTFFVPMTGRAEVLRHQKQDDGVPIVVNGGFEQHIGQGTPMGWYNLRQATVASDSGAPEGKAYLHFENKTPGRLAVALQAMGLDGRRFKEIEISVAVRPANVMLGDKESYSGVAVRFYDEQRARVSAARFGPWSGSASWSEHGTRFRVPPETRLVVIGLGLFGATGELAFDSLQVKANQTVVKGPFD
ncbi:MAG: protein-L-isoaspartate O-methyltransferase [Planctomycetaceae bacterium]|nr:protein-L-isoaspartate O-methyltransferase [Planctomycetaceae bacterium]